MSSLLRLPSIFRWLLGTSLCARHAYGLKFLQNRLLTYCDISNVPQRRSAGTPHTHTERQQLPTCSPFVLSVSNLRPLPPYQFRVHHKYHAAHSVPQFAPPNGKALAFVHSHPAIPTPNRIYKNSLIFPYSKPYSHFSGGLSDLQVCFPTIVQTLPDVLVVRFLVSVS